MLRPVLFAVCLANLLTAANVSRADITGHAKSVFLVQNDADAGTFSIDRIHRSQNSIRLMWEDASDWFAWQFHYEASPIFSSRSLAVDNRTLAIPEGSYRLTDLSNQPTTGDTKHTVYQNLDRLNVQFRFGSGDLTVGRQAMAFGSARIINPTDVFLPFDVQTISQEYRIGVDAVRYQAPIGELGELDLGVVLGSSASSEDSAIFLQLRENVGGVDLQLAAARFAGQSMIGGGMQSALGEFGFWLEAAAVTSDEDYVRASVGLDYAFSERSLAQLEYHYNGAGSDQPGDYLSQLTTTPFQRGGVFLLGEHYLMPAFSVQVSPIWTVGLTAIVNLSDRSTFLSATTDLNLAEDLYAEAGYRLFIGDGVSVNQSGLPLVNSEYGASPDVVFLGLRFYF